MKHSPFTRWIPWLVIALYPALLGHCGGAAEHGTETGNLPVVEQQKLHVVLRDTGVEVVGDAGAVSPGASVSVTNRTSGESAEATAGADGSIHIVVPGSLQDDYDVTVWSAGGSQTVRVATETSAGSAGAGNDGTSSPPASGGASGTSGMLPSGPDPLLCASLKQTLGSQVTAAFAGADKTCQRDEECEDASVNAGCFFSCDTTIASRAGAEAARATIAQEIAPLCDVFSSQGCESRAPACGNQATYTTCKSGACTALGSLSCSEFSGGASARVTIAINTAPRICSRDSDCALMQAELSCVASCGNRFYSVASSALQDLTNLIAQTDGLYCGLADLRGCLGPIALPCEPMTEAPRASCNNFMCRVTYASVP